MKFKPDPYGPPPGDRTSPDENQFIDCDYTLSDLAKSLKKEVM